jgi:hypothetical protein
MFYSTANAKVRLYGVYELFRRAGVSRLEWEACRVNTTSSQISVHLSWDHSKHIDFPFFTAYNGPHGTARLNWMSDPGQRTLGLVPNLVLPHHPLPLPEGPLFQSIDQYGIRCATDLPLITVAVLNRWEERYSTERDKFGRFTAHSSIAFREKFLNRPIVDEYGLALRQAIQSLCPRWNPSRSEPTLKLSHDIDQTGIPFRIRSAIGHTVRRHRPLDTIRAFLSLSQYVDPPTLKTVDQIVGLSLDMGLDSAVYWMAAQPSTYDAGYSLYDRRIQSRV